MLELLNNWAIPNIHDMRRLSHVLQAPINRIQKHVVAETLASHPKSTAMKDRASLFKAKRPYEEMASCAARTNSHKMRWQPHMITIS